MSIQKMITQSSALAFMTFLLTACSSQTVEEEEYGGFLPNYKQLAKMESTDGVEILGWRKPGLHLADYHAIVIAPVILSPDAQIGDRIPAAELKDMRKTLHAKMVEEVSKVMEIAAEPAPGVILYSLALSGAAAVDRNLRWFEYTPITFTASKIASASGNRDDVVELWVEAKWTDSVTGELLASAIRKGQSKDTVGADETVDADHVSSLLEQWANSSRISLQKLRE
jgi:hypothetical protein